MMESKKILKKQKKKTPHLDYYKECMKEGRLGITSSKYFIHGLCTAAYYRLIRKSLLKKMFPTHEDFEELEKRGHSTTHWASGDRYSKVGKFTPLRQTIVLFMAALNNEL